MSLRVRDTLNYEKNSPSRPLLLSQGQAAHDHAGYRRTNEFDHFPLLLRKPVTHFEAPIGALVPLLLPFSEDTGVFMIIMD